MKKVFTFKYAVLTALFLAVSCAKEPVPAQVSVEEIPQVTFTATMEGGLDTRTTLGGDDLTKVLWTDDDAIKVYSGDNSGKMQIGDISGGVATFSGNLVSGSAVQGSQYWAMYPYTCVSSFSDGVFTANLPAKQRGIVNSFGEDVSFTISRANLTEDGSTHFHFLNTCSGIRFKLDPTLTEAISKVTIYANGGESLAGKFTASFGTDGNPVTESVSGKGVSRVTLVPASGSSFKTDTWYYIITLPVKLQGGFTMVLEGSNVVRTFSYTSSLAFNRSKFRTVTLKSSNSPEVTRQEDEFTTTYYITSQKERDYIDAARRSYGRDLGPDGYNSSVVETYATDNSYQYPNTIPFKWSRNTYPNAVKLKFSDDPSFSTSTLITSTLITFEDEIVGFNVYNLFPEVTYYYRLYDSNGSVISGLRSVTPKGPVRTIKVTGVNNFRDLGGWTGEGGKTIRFGKIYRGTQFSLSGGGGHGSSSSSSLDVSTFIGSNDYSSDNPYTGSSPFSVPLGIKHDVDLRGLGGGSASQPLKNYDVGYVNYKVRQFMYNSGSYGETAYLYQSALRYVINSVANDEPVYFHCIGGADRTGTLAFLIEALLGVSELDMNIDYELTSFNDIRRRDNDSDRPFKHLVIYLYSFTGTTLQDKVTNWAKTSFSSSVQPLTDDEINTLKELMLE